MLMPSRTSNSDKYRFGFNGQEKDDEVSGIGNMNTAEFWEYDTRLGRRWNLDPKPQISISDYACFNNNPIWHNDILGDTVVNGNASELEIAKNKQMNANKILEITNILLTTLKNKSSILSLCSPALKVGAEMGVINADKEVANKQELFDNTQAVMNEFKTTNPDEYNYWDTKLLNDGAKYVVLVKSQYGQVQMYDNQTGQRIGKTNEGTGSNPTIGAVIILTKTDYNNIKQLQELTFLFVHALGHAYNNERNDPLVPNTETNADRYANSNYGKFK